MSSNKEKFTAEPELPETQFVRDIENRVFQAIVLQVLERIPGVALIERNLIDSLFGRGGSEKIKAIGVEQETGNHSVKIRVEVNVLYGIPIPEKAEQVQSEIAAEVTRLTGLHVSQVHVVFRGILLEEPLPAGQEPLVLPAEEGNKRL